MALTKAAYNAVLNLGNGGAWDCHVSTARLSSDPRVGLTVYLMGVQNGVCAFCGLKDSQMEMCHIVPGGPARKGWLAGNIAMGCRTCNEIDTDTVIAYPTIKRPDLIAISWPSIPILAEMGRQAKRDNETKRLARRKIRGM